MLTTRVDRAALLNEQRVHLLAVLGWCYDRSVDCRSTDDEDDDQCRLYHATWLRRGHGWNVSDVLILPTDDIG